MTSSRCSRLTLAVLCVLVLQCLSASKTSIENALEVLDKSTLPTNNATNHQRTKEPSIKSKNHEKSKTATTKSSQAKGKKAKYNLTSVLTELQPDEMKSYEPSQNTSAHRNTTKKFDILQQVYNRLANSKNTGKTEYINLPGAINIYGPPPKGPTLPAAQEPLHVIATPHLSKFVTSRGSGLRPVPPGFNEERVPFHVMAGNRPREFFTGKPQHLFLPYQQHSRTSFPKASSAGNIGAIQNPGVRQYTSIRPGIIQTLGPDPGLNLQTGTTRSGGLKSSRFSSGSLSPAAFSSGSLSSGGLQSGSIASLGSELQAQGIGGLTHIGPLFPNGLGSAPIAQQPAFISSPPPQQLQQINQIQQLPPQLIQQPQQPHFVRQDQHIFSPPQPLHYNPPAGNLQQLTGQISSGGPIHLEENRPPMEVRPPVPIIEQQSSALPLQQDLPEHAVLPAQQTVFGPGPPKQIFLPGKEVTIGQTQEINTPVSHMFMPPRKRPLILERPEIERMPAPLFHRHHRYIRKHRHHFSK